MNAAARLPRLKRALRREKELEELVEKWRARFGNGNMLAAGGRGWYSPRRIP